MFAMEGVFTAIHPPHLLLNTDHRCRVIALRARTSSASQDGVNMNREQDGIMGRAYTAAGNQWLTILNREQWLLQTSDLALTLSGVCLCAFWATLLYHLL